MKIEEGKTYMDGEGTIVGPMESSKLGTFKFRGKTTSGNYKFYTQDGFYNKDTRCPEDLVAEYKAPPVFINPSAYFSGKEKILTDDDCMAYTEQNNDDTSLPLLNIFKPIRKKLSNIQAEFLARANDGSYIFAVGNPYDLERVDAENVDREFENVPDPEPTKALIYLCQNSVTGDKYIRSIKPVEDKLLESCELTYSEEQRWQVRDLKGEK